MPPPKKRRSRKESGALWRTREYGQLIDSFEIRAGGRDYAAELRYGRETHRTVGLGVTKGGYRFTGWCQILPDRTERDHDGAQHHYGPQVAVVHGQIGDDVVKQLRADVLRLADVRWEPYVRVEVSPADGRGRPGYGGHAGMRIEYDFLLLGTRPDGSRCYREDARISERCDWATGDTPVGQWYSRSWIQDGLPDITSGRDDAEPKCSLLPYTPELHDALRGMTQRLDAIAEATRKLLSGPDVARITAAITSGRLLPAPAATKRGT